MYHSDMRIENFDAELWEAMEAERVRQEDHLELIASENYTSPRVLEAQGSVLTNKYAEGYPGRRYYGGCEYIDIAEDLAIKRAKQLFGADYANVQPHSGSQANAAVYLALLEPGDTVLGMGMDAGGHMTHGAKISFSGIYYKSFSYGVDPKTGLIDYGQVAELARKHKPKMLMTGFSSYSRLADWQRLREIADGVGAYMVSDIAHVAGMIAVGLYPSPIQIADVTTTTTHKTLRGPRSGLILAKANPEIEKRLDRGVFPGMQGGPLMHVIAAKAVAFKEALAPEFKVYQQQVMTNAKAMVEAIKARGYSIVSDGTDNHLLVINLIGKDYSGKEVEDVLESAHITINKNSVPDDPRPPVQTSGIRLGTPAITTRGFKEPEVHLVADWLCDVLDAMGDEERLQEAIRVVRRHVVDLCRRFPVYR